MDSKRLPVARHQQILQWLEEEGSLSVTELQSRLKVSHMTVHRDLKQLADSGVIRKVRGGAMPTRDLAEEYDRGSCFMCGGHTLRRLAFIIKRSGGERILACCPHCGIMLLSDMTGVDTALAKDYIYGRMVNAYQAHYLISSEVRLCCEPTVLCFAGRVDAQKFSRGFGGQIMKYHQALDHLKAAHHHKLE